MFRKCNKLGCISALTKLNTLTKFLLYLGQKKTKKLNSLLLCHPVKEKLTEYIRIHGRQILLDSGAGPSAPLGERGSDEVVSLADCTLPVVSRSENWRQEKFNRY